MRGCHFQTKHLFKGTKRKMPVDKEEIDIIVLGIW